MNKKLLLLFPFLALGIVGCSKAPKQNENEQSSEQGEDSGGSGDTTPSEEPPTFGEEVHTYLVLGEYGLYRGTQGQKIPDLFLEHTIDYVAKIGDPLPTETDVTTTISGSHFLHWQAYEGDSTLKVYDVVPLVRGKILYACYSGGDGGGADPSGDVMPQEGYGLMFGDQTYTVGILQEEKDTQDRVQYLISQHHFTAGETFQLYDFANKSAWVEDLDPWSFGNTSGSGVFWPHYVQKGSHYYTALTDFTCDVYIKTKWEDNIVYFGDVKPNEKLDIDDIDLPSEGYGIMMSDGVTYTTATPTGSQDEQGRDQYSILDISFKQGDRFQIYDFGLKNGWVENLDGYSFGGSSADDTKWQQYLTKGNLYYTVLQDIEVDLYIKLKYEDNLIYIGFASGGGDVPPTPVDPDDSITIYFAGVTGWSDISSVDVKVGNNEWATMSATSNDPKGDYVYSVAASEDATTLNLFFTQFGGSQYRHPTTGEIDWDINNSTINLNSVHLQPGHVYCVTNTGYHYNYDNWEHAWFNYTFTEIQS